MTSRDELFCILRPDGDIIGCSHALQSLFGATPPGTSCHRLQDVLLPGQEHRWPRILSKLQRYPATSALLQCRTVSGQRLYLQGYFTPATPVLHGAIRAVFQDIGAHYQARRMARQNLRLMLDMARETSAAITILDQHNRIRFWSDEAADLFGYTRDEIHRKAFATLFDTPCQEIETLTDRPLAACEDKAVTGRHKDSATVAAALRLIPLQSRHRHYTLAMFLPQRLRNQSQIEQLAYYDQLTGLPNRTLLKDRLELALAEAARYNHPLAVLFVDLDRFKQVNDTLGHAAGDQLLKIAGQRLQQCLRNNDTVARLGGDEFVIVLSGFRDKSNLPKILEKILTTLSCEYLVGSHRMVMTASIGIAIAPEDGTCADNLMRHADTAMYVAKERTGNSYQLFSREMNHTLVAQLELETRLRRALDNWEFFLLFQPRYHLATQQPVGAEAFLRWSHPDGNPLPPASFLPRLEEMGLMPALGERILRKACEIGCTWQKPDLPPLPVAVNLSCSQFIHQDLQNRIAAILHETGLPGECLELEIDESTLQKSAEKAERVLKDIRQMGVSWALDNFGLGYTSLHHLKTLPFDYLKIDRHFVQNLPHSQCDAAMVGAILAMARNLGISAVAEGIESFAQHHLLLAMGCRRGQGFLFQKPARPEALHKTLSRNGDAPGCTPLLRSGTAY